MPVPANDDLANATDITATLAAAHATTTIDATEEADEVTVLGFCGPDVASVWLKFQAPVGANALTVSADNLTPGHHPWLELFEAANSTPDYTDLTATGQHVGIGVDDVPPSVWRITPGQWYVVYVGSYDCPPSNTEGAVTVTFAAVTLAAGWTYDGASLVTYTITDAVVGDQYRIYCSDPDSSNHIVTAESATLIMVVDDVGGFSAGEGFSAAVYHGDSSSVSFLDDDAIGVTTFAIGSASTVGMTTIAAWEYDGDTQLSATIYPLPGVTYRLQACSVAGGPGCSSAAFGPYSPGTATELLATIASPSPGDRVFEARLEDDSSGVIYTNRLITGGEAGAGALGNPLVAPTPPTPSGGRFFHGFKWRIVVTDLDTVTETMLDHFAAPISLEKTRNAPAKITVGMPSDNPEVNIEADDGDPFVAEGSRLVYLFRREGTAYGSSVPWVIRGAGIALDLEDAANADVPVTSLLAYDPWKYLYRRPIITDGGGTLPGEDGLTYLATTGDAIIIEQLQRTEADAGTTRIDYGFSGFYTGTIETTDVIDEITFQRGAMIGEALDALVQTGTLDVVLEPIYDPVNRPGYTHQMSIYVAAGDDATGAVFGWDRWPKNVPTISRRVDGSARANKVLFYAGQGGIPTAVQQNATSIARFGEYWQIQYFPGKTALADATLAAERQLELVKNGEFFYSFEPATDRAPIPLVEYDIHDTVPLYASRRLREPISQTVKVETLRLEVTSEAVERATLTVAAVPEPSS